MTLFDPPPWESLPVLRYGAGGNRTDIDCGYLHSEDPLFGPGLQALPPVFVVRPPDGPAARWVESSISYAWHHLGRADRPTFFHATSRIAVGRSIAPAPRFGSDRRAWMDRRFARSRAGAALAQLHAAPDQKWTVAELAASAMVSRSLLDERFRQKLGRSPIRYLTEWRMQIAKKLLASTDPSDARIARRVGGTTVVGGGRLRPAPDVAYAGPRTSAHDKRWVTADRGHLPPF